MEAVCVLVETLTPTKVLRTLGPSGVVTSCRWSSTLRPNRPRDGQGGVTKHTFVENSGGEVPGRSSKRTECGPSGLVTPNYSDSSRPPSGITKINGSLSGVPVS